MNRSRTRVASLALAVIMIMSVGATGGAVAGTSGNDTTSEEPAEETFIVQQGEDCYAATTLGDGTETVESFYNYSADYDWSSEGTKHLQENQVSNLFVYEGAEGYSLVFVHDEHGDGPHGSTTTFTIDGQPADGEWAVEDDDYQGRDDNFNHYGTHSEIDWKWAPDRNDGAAFRGLTVEDDVAITIDPAFNEEANAWGDWTYSGDEDNRTESWQLLGEDGEPVTTLDMNENVTVTTGTCGTGLNAALSVNDSSVTTDQPVEFDASGSTSGAAIVEYHWDFNGDGETDDTTDTATTTHAYANDGEFDATVTAVDESGNEDSASTTVTVSAKDDEQKDTKPTAKLDAPAEATVNSTVTLDASASTDDEGIVKYHWDLDGDSETDETTESATYEKWVTATGEFEPTVTVEDADGNTDTASTHLTVTEDKKEDTEAPTATLKAPDKVTVGEEFTAEATDVSDPSGVAHVCWYHDGEAGPEGETMTHTFEETGEHTVSVMLRDEAGNEQKITHTIEVVAGSDDKNSDDKNSDDKNSDDKNSDDSNNDDSDESDNDDTNSTPISNDHDTDDDEPDISVTSVNVSADEVEIGENVSVNVTLTNDGDADGTHTVSLTATGPAENATSENATVDVDADETQNVTLTTSFATAGEYNVTVDNETVALTVTETETETATETDDVDSDESDKTDSDTETDTETESDDAGGAQEPDGDDSATGASGPGFGALSVLVAALIGVGMLVRRL